MGGRIQFFGLASPSLPMIVSNARQGASKVHDQPSKRAICLARENVDLPHGVAQGHDDEDGSDDLKEKEKLAQSRLAISEMLEAISRRRDCR